MSSGILEDKIAIVFGAGGSIGSAAAGNSRQLHCRRGIGLISGIVKSGHRNRIS
jgi:hypothetical protein